MADAEAGRFSVIVVHTMDRFARKLCVALECLEQLGRAHVGVVSVSEPNLDYSAPQRFRFLSMLGALAEWYSRNLANRFYVGELPVGKRGADGWLPAREPIAR
jgi:DNA invertase Pin-like site-specific DNA recombinase